MQTNIEFLIAYLQRFARRNTSHIPTLFSIIFITPFMLSKAVLLYDFKEESQEVFTQLFQKETLKSYFLANTCMLKSFRNPFGIYANFANC